MYNVLHYNTNKEINFSCALPILNGTRFFKQQGNSMNQRRNNLRLCIWNNSNTTLTLHLFQPCRTWNSYKHMNMKRYLLTVGKCVGQNCNAFAFDITGSNKHKHTIEFNRKVRTYHPPIQITSSRSC